MGITSRILPLIFKNAAVKIVARLFSSSDAGSEIYKRALKLQRPTTVMYDKNFRNSVNLIGTIEEPLKECKTSNRLGIHTRLRVKASSSAYRDIWVLLKFWDEMAEIAVQHIKLRDFVCISGQLGAYMKLDQDGKTVRNNYKVVVSEINFVAQHKPEVSAEDMMQKRRDRLRLWHIFFSNPYEWWDNRNNKLSPHYPDFKHKDTGEGLWLKDNDPPWLKKQIQLIDSGLIKRNTGKFRNGRLQLSSLVYDDDDVK